MPSDIAIHQLSNHQLFFVLLPIWLLMAQDKEARIL
jgi:hypothetical protein